MLNWNKVKLEEPEPEQISPRNTLDAFAVEVQTKTGKNKPAILR